MAQDMPELRAIAEDLDALPAPDCRDAWFHDALVFLENRGKLEDGEGRTRKTLKPPERVVGQHWLLCVDLILQRLTGRGPAEWWADGETV